MRTLFSLCLLLSLLLSLPAVAAAPVSWPSLSTPPATSAGDGSKDAALVIGIEDYAFAQDLPGARQNALDWMQWLQKTRGVPVVKPLLNNNATKEEILDAAAKVAGLVQPGGRMWVVFIGHGAPSRAGDDGLLVGVDAQQTALSLEARAVPQQQLLTTIKRALPAGAETVMVVDACFSGKTASGDLAPGLGSFKPVANQLYPLQVTALTAGKSDEYAGPLSDGSRPA
ncbi:MAG: caspase family protein, partial [Oligoflexia bacterium]|nr:caspase family protein [Oligoflexia bacterium]